jgi:hypothetical protein
MSKLTDAERTIIFNALTTAAHQYSYAAGNREYTTPLSEHNPGREQFGSENLQHAPHLNRLRRVVQLAIASIVHGEHQHAVQDRQFVMRLHAADELIAQTIACLV